MEEQVTAREMQQSSDNQSKEQRYEHAQSALLQEIANAMATFATRVQEVSVHAPEGELSAIVKLLIPVFSSERRDEERRALTRGGVGVKVRANVPSCHIGREFGTKEGQRLRRAFRGVRPFSCLVSVVLHNITSDGTRHPSRSAPCVTACPSCKSVNGCVHALDSFGPLVA